MESGNSTYDISIQPAGTEKSHSDTYHCCHIETHRSKEEGQHPEKVKELAQSVNITTQSLLSIAWGHFGFKCSNLIQPHISAFSNLQN